MTQNDTATAMLQPNIPFCFTFCFIPLADIICNACVLWHSTTLAIIYQLLCRATALLHAGHFLLLNCFLVSTLIKGVLITLSKQKKSKLNTSSSLVTMLIVLYTFTSNMGGLGGEKAMDPLNFTVCFQWDCNMQNLSSPVLKDEATCGEGKKHQ